MVPPELTAVQPPALSGTSMPLLCIGRTRPALHYRTRMLRGDGAGFDQPRGFHPPPLASADTIEACASSSTHNLLCIISVFLRFVKHKCVNSDQYGICFSHSGSIFSPSCRQRHQKKAGGCMTTVCPKAPKKCVTCPRRTARPPARRVLPRRRHRGNRTSGRCQRRAHRRAAYRSCPRW